MNSNIAIKVEKVSKNFVLPHEKVSSVKGLFTGLTRKRGHGSKETQHALEGISFEVKKGEFFGIVGRNGSGKSTLLKILAGIYQPTTGEVSRTGKLVPFIELGVGFNPELTGRENVYLNGAMLGFDRKEIDAMYNDIVLFAEIERFMDQKLKNYSSGMQVRLAFSMAIRAQADILLIDEVLAVGDADFQRKCFDYFKKLKRNKKTVVFVSHDMNAVREYCDRAIMIEKSKIIASGSASKIATQYTRMFIQDNHPNNITPINEKQNRWGDKTFKITEIRIDKITDQEISFIMRVEATRYCEDPLFGFYLRNGMGESLLGINTQLNGLTVSSMREGEIKVVKCCFANILAEGEYAITVAAQYDNGTSIGDWWEDALEFSIRKSIRTPYRVQPDIKIVTRDIERKAV